MATLDIFNDDAFGITRLTQTIIDIPRVETMLGDEGLFAEYGIDTLTMGIERQGSSLSLVPTAPRGGVRNPIRMTGRKLIHIGAVHIPQVATVMADEVQGVRAFGSETEVEAVSTKVRNKLGVMKGNLDLTLEHMRIGAVKGKVVDADGVTELWDMYDIFDMVQPTMDFDLGDPNSDLKAKSIQLKYDMQQKLGGRPLSGVLVYASREFFLAYVNHANMLKAWDRWQDGRYLREDQTKADFEFMDVRWRIYAGGTSAGDFIEPGEAYARPVGIPRQFQTAYAPADYMETVNTNGLPYYAKQERMPFDRGVEMESQSNPIMLNTLPETVFKLRA